MANHRPVQPHRHGSLSVRISGYNAGPETRKGQAMGDVVGLHGRFDDDELVENLARFSDGTLTEAMVRARHHLSNEDWAAMGENDQLVERVEARKLARIRSGRTKRELAQREIVDAPPILGKLMRSLDTNPRHVIDSIKVLDGLATGGGSEAAGTGAIFEIRIDMTADGGDLVAHYRKSIEINPNDGEPLQLTPIAEQDGDGGF
jgi:hypothetical protein